MGSPIDLGLVQTRQNTSEIRRKCRQHLRALSTHTHQSNGRLRMYAHLGAVDDANGIDLCLPSCRAATVSTSRTLQTSTTTLNHHSRIISIPAAFTVVHTARTRSVNRNRLNGGCGPDEHDHGSFERHPGWSIFNESLAQSQALFKHTLSSNQQYIKLSWRWQRCGWQLAL